MLWLVIFVALLIPLTAVVLDSPVVRSMMERKTGGGDAALNGDVKELARKLGVLEEEIEALKGELGHLQDNQEFMQRLLEDPAARQAAAKLQKPNS